MEIAFVNALKQDFEADPAEVALFDQGWDGDAVFVPPKVVSKNLIDGKLITGYRALGNISIPEVVPLESSLARNEGSEWKLFDPAERQLPTSFISQCYTANVKKDLRNLVARSVKGADGQN